MLPIKKIGDLPDLLSRPNSIYSNQDENQINPSLHRSLCRSMFRIILRVKLHRFSLEVNMDGTFLVILFFLIRLVIPFALLILLGTLIQGRSEYSQL